MLGATGETLSLDQHHLFHPVPPTNWTKAGMVTKHDMKTFDFITNTLLRYSFVSGEMEIDQKYTTTTKVQIS
jgi:hypothetical protein